MECEVTGSHVQRAGSDSAEPICGSSVAPSPPQLSPPSNISTSHEIPNCRLRRLFKWLKLTPTAGAPAHIDIIHVRFPSRHPTIQGLVWFPIGNDLALPPGFLHNLKRLSTSRSQKRSTRPTTCRIQRSNGTSNASIESIPPDSRPRTNPAQRPSQSPNPLNPRSPPRR